MLAFDKHSHSYTFEGKQFKQSVTGVTKKYMPEFPAEQIANATAKRDGTNAQDILDKWALNGEVSSTYGTSVHKAVEYWLRFGEIPNQLGDIVKKFTKVWKPTGRISPEMAVYSEVLSLCGTMDMFEDLGDKKCIIHDIKTGDLEKAGKSKMLSPFEGLKATPLNKYRLQLSIYKHLIELLGWKVEGLVIWWWDNKDWKRVDIEALKTNEIL